MKERILAEKRDLELVAEMAVDFARKEGADEAVVKMNKSTGLDVSCRHGELENIDFNKSRSLSVSVLRNHQKGHARTADFSDAAIRETVRAALSIARTTMPDPIAGLPASDEFAREPEDFDILNPEEPDPDECLRAAVRLEELAMSRDPRITDSRGAGVSNHYGMNIMVNSAGFMCSEASSYFSKSVCVMADDSTGKQTGGSYTNAVDKRILLPDEFLAREAVREAIECINPKKIPTCTCPVIFRFDCAPEIISPAVSAIIGSNQYYKCSFLQDCRGKQVFPEWLTMSSDPRVRGHISAQYCDSEGVATRRCDLFKRGVAVDYLHSCVSARKLGEKTNGHAGGALGIVTLLDERGTKRSYKDLLRAMDKGLVVISTMGQGINSMNGDLSVGVTGFWIENGVIQYPVSGITIAGNLKNMYLGICGIADDADMRQRFRTGSVMIDRMTVAGGE